jgi:glycerophosphoryl diester phosphodiesterase
MKPLIVGHRGFAGRFPENTFASVKAACEFGVKWIEIDLQLTADHQLVVFHDFSLNRCSNGKGKVAEKKLSELQSLDFGAWFDPRFAHEPILTFRKLLSYLNSNDVCVNIELKSEASSQEILVKSVIAELKAQAFQTHRFIVSSFNHNALRLLHQLEPQIQIGVLSERLSKKDWAALKELNAYSCHLNYHLITAKHIEELKQANYQIWCYTINSPKKFKHLAKVDAIFTDFPDRFLPLSDGF